MGQLYKEMGFVNTGHTVQATRADLVGQYIGHTGPKTREMITRSFGGILFIDEAYGLKHEGSKDSFGQEVIDCLVSEIEKHKSDVVFILAGYTKEMSAFLSSNQGLDSRFPMKITFAPYSFPELAEIFVVMLKAKN